MSPDIVTHLFVEDATPWLDRIRRCRRVVGITGEACGLPEHNRIHKVPDRTREMDEHRRRAGEGERE